MAAGTDGAVTAARDLALALEALRVAEAERDAAADRILTLEADVARLGAQLEAAAERQARLRAALTGMAASASWRVTRPLRAMRGSHWLEAGDDVDGWLDAQGGQPR